MSSEATEGRAGDGNSPDQDLAGSTRSMRCGEALMSGIFLFVGVYAVIGAIRMQFQVDGGPGPGFFPLFLGAIIIGCASVILVRVVLVAFPETDEGFLPGRLAVLRGVGTLIALALFAYSANYIGFKLAMFLLLLFMTAVISDADWKVAGITAVVGSFGAYYFFNGLLGVFLPLAGIPVLANLGL